MKQQSSSSQTNTTSQRSWLKKPRARKESSPPWELFLTCETLTVDRFEKCLNGDLTQIVKSGEPPIDDILEVWHDIYTEWLDLNQNSEALYLLSLQKDIAVNNEKIEQVETAIGFLKIGYDERLLKILHNNNISCELDKNNPELYMENLEIAGNQLAHLKFDNERKQADYDEAMKSKDTAPKNGKYFDKWLTAIARFRKIPVIRKSEITVSEFHFMVEDYIEMNSSSTKNDKE